MEPKSKEVNKPVFVIGCPRSGTTLMAGLLNKIRNATSFESHFIPKYYKNLNRYGSLKEKKNIKSLIVDILHERSIKEGLKNLEIAIDIEYRGQMSGVCFTVPVEKKERDKEHRPCDQIPHSRLPSELQEQIDHRRGCRHHDHEDRRV